MPNAERIDRIKQIRRTIAKMSRDAGAAHLGSSLSCVEILDSIITSSNLTADTISDPSRDRIVVSKGHAAMAFYATLAEHKLIDRQHIENYLENGSSLWGHVTRTRAAPVIDYSTGSLGHGLSLAAGHTLGYKLRNTESRVYCLLSDGECNEGSTWEAALFAGHHRLSNLTAVVDYNKIQSFGYCSEILDLEPLASKWQAFRWEVSNVDGHDLASLDNALCKPSERPHIIIANTIKGKGVARIEGTIESHYIPASDQDVMDIQ
jgi:transketolase